MQKGLIYRFFSNIYFYTLTLLLLSSISAWQLSTSVVMGTVYVCRHRNCYMYRLAWGRTNYA